jgi:hypothetical protein
MPTTTKLLGTQPNQVPRNRDLGNLAFQDAQNIAGSVGVGGALTVAGGAATVAGAVDAGGGVAAEQLVVDNFTASSSAVLRGGATNLLVYSEQFDNAAWNKSDATVTANASTAPDGTLTADKVIATATNTAHIVFRTPDAFTAGVTYAFSYYAKAAEYTKAGIRIGGAGYTITPLAVIDLTNGAILYQTGFTSLVVQSVGNGWYRMTGAFVAGTGLTTNMQPLSDSYVIVSSNFSYTGDGTSGIYIWGAQLNTGNTAQPYLKTVGNAVSTAYAATLESPNGLAIPLLTTMTPARNSDMTFELASNTSLVVKVRGSDGVVRAATLTLA